MGRTLKRNEYYDDEDNKFDRKKRNFKKIRSNIKNRLKNIDINTLDKDGDEMELYYEEQE